ncbi:diphthine--ammonia ligase [Cimex lectularius]|uniref:Diphthine--ammonia ligase n=1 Tax=Cimex lectularius TaxID=79782 RepID=A0A8I6TB80_CIMLE|nr:diphthine--ammonia ligase [Cimex lectularius]XP_014239940.1 diphthine--ammonia ligase [Cimex lectularius]XP_014239941.1 diphthine--ammonia ligase [Cimex lectularius]
MRVVALISGGKDSCYNMLQCVMAGHEIVALANLKPDTRDELDSYMYQTVGHQGVEMYAEALNLPLFRYETSGVALQNEKMYTPTPEDEVEDLYKLLLNVKKEVHIEAVGVGAVLSDYQRLRVENVCARLGLVTLAYLWRRDQGELLQEMINTHIDAIVIKVAALGLDPAKHLGLKISEIQPHLIKMNEKYGLNICGEGGEYETFTLDCPLFCKSLVIDDWETVIHSNDAIAPVGYLNFTKIRLVSKEGVDCNSSLADRLKICRAKTIDDYILDIDQAEVTDTDSDATDCDFDGALDIDPLLEIIEKEPSPNKVTAVSNGSGWYWVGGIVGENSDITLAMTDALVKLEAILQEKGLQLAHLVNVSLFLKDLSQYTQVNKCYLNKITGPNPPVRTCLGVGLNEQTPVMLNALAYSNKKHCMHVQSISHWAPANIGPYSQVIKGGEDVIYVAGQIGLVPGTMTLVSGGIRRQCRLALRHVGRLVKAMDKDTQLRDVVQGICYVTNASYIAEARKEWERRTNNAIVEYIVVRELPKSSLVEWQVWAHRGNTRFEYEETGCVVGENRVSIKRRWNYESSVSAIVCNVSTVSSVSNPVISNLNSVGFNCESLSEAQLLEVFRYAMSRLFKGVPPPTVQCEQNCNSNNNATLSPIPVCSLQLFYRVGRSPGPQLIHDTIAKLEEYNIATTVIPVCQLSHANTFISLCAVRHS